MSNATPAGDPHDVWRQHEQLCDQFERAIRANERLDIHDLLQQVLLPARPKLFADLVAIELDYRPDERPQLLAAYRVQFPEYKPELDALLAAFATPQPLLTDPWRGKPTVRPASLDDAAQLPKYQIVDILGSGSMGIVYRAIDPELKRTVAIKMIRGDQQDVDLLNRFYAEATAVAALNHNHIVTLYAIERHEQQPYAVLEFCEGGSLRDKLTREPPSFRESARLVEQLARATQVAHDHGILHRDLKPANVLLAADGTPKISDFGLAKNIQNDANQTCDGAIIGTPAYMSPEQADGRISELGPATDIYSLGVILYELLTGEPPFAASTGQEVLEKVRQEEPVPPRAKNPRVHPDVETICLKAMAKEPASRYATALELAEDLDRYARGEAIHARPESIAWRMWRRTVRHPWTMATLAVSILAILVIALLLQSIRHTQLVRTSVTQLEAVLRDPNWTISRLDQQLQRAHELRALSNADGERMEKRLWQSVQEGVTNMVNRPRLTMDELSQIEALVTHIGNLHGPTGEQLQNELTQRRSRLDIAWELAAPFENRDEVFPPRSTFITGNVLARVVAPSSTASSKAGGSVPASYPSLLRTSLSSAGNVQFLAIFAPGWEVASRLGITLDSQPARRGYELSLETTATVIDEVTQQTKPLSFAAAREQGSAITVRLWRNGVPQRERTLNAAQLPSDSLRLMIARAGEHLSGQLQNSALLEFDDLFPLGGSNAGSFGVEWPEHVAIEKLETRKQLTPLKSRPLERGDDFYGQERWDSALEEYRQEALSAGTTPLGQEARYKEAMTLVELGRKREAIPLLDRLAIESGSQWPSIAACRLWFTHIQDQNHEAADAAFEHLAANYRFEQLAAYLPDGMRNSILDSYEQSNHGLQMIFAAPNRVRNAQRSVAVAKYLNLSSAEVLNCQFSLVRAHRIQGETETAANEAWRLIQGIPTTSSGPATSLCSEYGWLMRELGTPRIALAELNRRLNGNKDLRVFDLLIERARVHCVLGNPAAAEKDLDQYLRLVPQSQQDLHYSTAARLMRGFLYEDRGEHEQALVTWREAAVNQSSVVVAYGGSMAGYGGVAILQAMIVGALSDSLSDRDIEAMLRRTIASLGDSRSSLLTAAYIPPAALLRQMWRTPRGRATARQIAFQEGSILEFTRRAPTVLIYELLRQSAFDSQPTPEQDQIVWEVADQFLRGAQEGTLTQLHYAQMVLAWKGTTGLLGWGGLAPQLEPPFRASVAYVLAHRFRRLKRPDDYQAFLRETIAVAEDSPAAALARAEQKFNQETK